MSCLKHLKLQLASNTLHLLLAGNIHEKANFHYLREWWQSVVNVNLYNSHEILDLCRHSKKNHLVQSKPHARPSALPHDCGAETSRTPSGDTSAANLVRWDTKFLVLQWLHLQPSHWQPPVAGDRWDFESAAPHHIDLALLKKNPKALKLN